MSRTALMPAFDPALAATEIQAFIKKVWTDSRADGIVVGLSGGVDSSVVATLSVRAIGAGRVLGVLMPTGFTPEADVRDARLLATQLGIRTEHVPIDPMVTAYRRSLNAERENPELKIPLANLRARIRMSLLYWFANRHNYVVAGTGDKSEDLIGYFTKYGDGGVDFLPIGHLYKSEVRALARHLGVPEQIAGKPSSPQLYPGHKATDEIPADYDVLEPILYALFDLKQSADEVVRRLGCPRSLVDEILRRYRTTAHKRMYPVMLRSW